MTLAALRHATGVATAIGENASNALDFKKMLAEECVDYVQPSVIKIGGLTPLWRICTESEAAGTTCVPHSPFFGPGYLATIHVLAAKERASALERFYCDLAFDPCGSFAPIAEGFIDIPDRPGLGGDGPADDRQGAGQGRDQAPPAIDPHQSDSRPAGCRPGP